jgi:hypothetical protein
MTGVDLLIARATTYGPEGWPGSPHAAWAMLSRGAARKLDQEVQTW